MISWKSDQLAEPPREGFAGCVLRAIWTALLDGAAMHAIGLYGCPDPESQPLEALRPKDRSALVDNE